jgi:FkbM family methyltransferase
MRINLAQCDHIEEEDIATKILAPLGQDRPRHMVQVGANEGMYEYAKPGNADFVFEFLRGNPNWAALLIEPIPDTYDTLVQNYAAHDNRLHFLNCAITDQVETRTLHISGRDGKSSSLHKLDAASSETPMIKVPCLPLHMACALVNWPRIDFLKIDAEGYDEIIIGHLLDHHETRPLPDLVLWEQLLPESMNTSERLQALGYRVFPTGRAKNGRFLDKIAISPAFLGS